MATLRISYPSVVWRSLDVDVSEERAEEVLNMYADDQANFIKQQHELQQAEGKPLALKIATALDYASIQRIR